MDKKSYLNKKKENKGTLVHFPFGVVVIATLSFVNKSNDEFHFQFSAT